MKENPKKIGNYEYSLYSKKDNVEETILKYSGDFYVPTKKLLFDWYKNMFRYCLLNRYFGYQFWVVGSFIQNSKTFSGDIDVLVYNPEYEYDYFNEKLIKEISMILKHSYIFSFQRGIYVDCQYSVDSPLDIINNYKKSQSSASYLKFVLGNVHSFNGKKKDLKVTPFSGDLYRVDYRFPSIKQVSRAYAGEDLPPPRRLKLIKEGVKENVFENYIRFFE